MIELARIKHYLLDMDGTFYLGDELIDGSMAFLEVIESQGKDFVFLTNNSSKNNYAYQEKLSRLGCEVEAERVFTSGEATTIYLKSIKENARIFLLGTKLLEDEFVKAGFKIVKNRDEKPDFVVLGFDTTLTYEKLWIACDLVREGIPYIATHPDYNCPLEGGKFMPDAGAIIDFIAASTGKRPHIVGKPNKEIIDAICIKYGYKREEVAMVGDRLYTDIKTGANAGVTSILVLSGETTQEDYNRSDISASYIYPSLRELGQELLKIGAKL